jgi:hypothetical protein
MRLIISWASDLGSVFESIAGVRRGAPGWWKSAGGSASLGRGSCEIDLTDEQYIRLLEAGCWDTCNGYEKRKEPEARHHGNGPR